MRMGQSAVAWGLLAMALAACVAAYLVGLRGPFVFDDGPNFAAIQPWLDGEIPTKHLLFGNSTFLTHRSLAMGSFMLGAKLFGFTPMSFKAINLVLHLLIGLVAFVVIRSLVRRDAALAARANLLASAVVAIWLLHPYNASTVLYAVQRMTQLATLCCLLGIGLYAWIRSRQQMAPENWRWALLYIAIPLLTLLGVQAKQNAIVLPGLCLVVELAYFSRPRKWPPVLFGFYGVFLAIPALALGAGVLLRPDLLLDGFAEYPFTLGERLLSEGRALATYVQLTLVPATPAMGVYTDDFTPSRGLFSPMTTAISWAFVLTLSALAVWQRSRHPSAFAGWFLFLVGHSVEASILPIEIYYEHRNYLPSLGLILAATALVDWAGAQLRTAGIRTGRVGGSIGIALLVILAVMSHGRARVWSDRFVLAESELASHPESVRAVINYAGLAEQVGDVARARAVLKHAAETARDGRVRGLSQVFLVRIDCSRQHRTASGALQSAFSQLPNHIDLSMTQILGYTNYLGSGKDACEGASRRTYAEALVELLDRANAQPDSAYPKWMLRHTAARLFADVGDWRNARIQGELSWQPNAPPVLSEPLIIALLKHGEVGRAEQVYAEARQRLDARVGQDAQGLRGLRQTMDRMIRALESQGDTSPHGKGDAKT